MKYLFSVIFLSLISLYPSFSFAYTNSPLIITTPGTYPWICVGSNIGYLSVEYDLDFSEWNMSQMGYWFVSTNLVYDNHVIHAGINNGSGCAYKQFEGFSKFSETATDGYYILTSSNTGSNYYTGYTIFQILNHIPYQKHLSDLLNIYPIINILGDNPLKISASTTVAFIDPGAISTDDIDGDITANIKTSSNVDITKVGTYSVVYTVSDRAGNVASSTRVVEVIAETKPKCCSNVLFIPGLEASRLYIDNNNGNEKRLWEPELFHDNSGLYLDSSGKSINSEIYTKDVIDNAYIPIKGNIYSSFISSMNTMKYDGIIDDWEAVPYDWRLSLDDILNNGKESSDGKIYYNKEIASTSNPYIISELYRLASSSKTGKVTIIAHSNGGLVTKELTDKLDPDASKLIDQIIFVAVPEVGTPEAIGALLHGFDQGLPKDWLPLFISPFESRVLGNNMPSAYNLLPSSQYFNYISDPVITFDNSDLLSSWRVKYGSVINSGVGLYNFLSDQSRETLPTTDDLVSLPLLNKNILDSANEIHNTKLDNWTPPAGVSLTEIAGWGEDTVSGIAYYQGISATCEMPSDLGCLKYSTSSVLEYNPKITSDGDGTIVVPSALRTASSTGVGKYWVNLQKYGASNYGVTIDRKHADIFEVSELLDLIKDVITQSTSTLPEYISTSTPPNSNLEKKLHFTLHSPLSLDLYDDQGNHTGISTTTNQIEENIPGSDYLTFGEVKYISVPASSTIYLFMQGYSSGSFNLNIEEVQGNMIIASTTFAGVPSSASTTATINIPDGNISRSSPLTVDENGDGDTVIKLLPKFGGISVPDLNSPQTIASTTGIMGNNDWYLSNVSVSFSATDTDSSVLKTEYSFDGENFTKSTSSILVTKEGETEIYYRSIDNVGNIEIPKSVVIKIDKTIPEFLFNVDPQVFELNVSGYDISSTTISIKDITGKRKKDRTFSYTVKDEVNKTSAMTIEINRESDLKLNYDINFPDVKGSKEVSVIFERQLDKKGNLKTFIQTIKQGRDVITYTYNLKKNKTIIRTRDGKEIYRKVYNEQKNVEFVTNKGTVDIKL
jgi:hypothetical protein